MLAVAKPDYRTEKQSQKYEHSKKFRSTYQYRVSACKRSKYAPIREKEKYKNKNESNNDYADAQRLREFFRKEKIDFHQKPRKSFLNLKKI